MSGEFDINPAEVDFGDDPDISPVLRELILANTLNLTPNEFTGRLHEEGIIDPPPTAE